MSENNIIDKIDGKSKFNIAEFMAKKLAMSKTLIKSIKPSSRLGFLVFKTWLAFAKLRQTFIKALIFYYFDLKYYV